MSVEPNDSVSRRGSELEKVGSVVGLVPPDSFLSLYANISSCSPEQLDTLNGHSQRYYKAYEAYCASLSASSVPDPSSGESSQAALDSPSERSGDSFHLERGFSSAFSASSSKVRRARRAAAFRTKYVRSAPFPQGFCYSKLFRPAAQEAVAQQLSEWPTVSSILSQPADVTTSWCLLESLVLVRVAGGFHVLELNRVPKSVQAWSLNGALIGLARRSEFPFGSFGASLASAYRLARPMDSPGLLQLDDKLGGVFSPLSEASKLPAEKFMHEAAHVVSCPAPLPTGNRRRVFLAGTDEDVECMGWRAEAVNRLAGLPCEVNSPKYARSKALLMPSLDCAPFKEKLDWEHKALAAADLIFFNFLSNTTSSVSLLELGLYASSGKVVVRCPDSYLRAANVKHVCQLYNIPCFGDLPVALDYLYGRVESLIAPRDSTALIGAVDLSEVGSCTASAAEVRPLVKIGSPAALYPGWAPDAALRTVRTDGKFVLEPDKVTSLMAFDCEMVRADKKKNGSVNVLGRVSLVNFFGQTVFDTFVYHDDLKILNTNKAYGSGITWEDIKPGGGAMRYHDAVAHFRRLTNGASLVAHDPRQDVVVLGLTGAEAAAVLDTQHRASTVVGRRIGLRDAAFKFLHRHVQADPVGHSSVEDALTSMALWRWFDAGFHSQEVDSLANSVGKVSLYNN